MRLSIPAQAAFGVGLAAMLAFLATPVAIGMARRFAFYDLPQGYKAHGRPTPYLGGLAVMTAFTITTLVAAGHAVRTVPLLGAGAVLMVVGTVDDRRTVSPQLRVLIESALGVLLAVLHVGWQLGAGELVDCAVTAVWVVGIVNAFNLFDNMDGASSTLALVSSGGVCALALVTGNAWVAAGSAALCGACLGFLPHNLSSPARIFLGDGGSMPIGFAVAILAANAARAEEPGFLGLLVGFLLVGVAALDTALVIVSRSRRGIPLLTGGRDHLTHRTRLRMKTPLRVALVLGGAQAAVSATVIVASQAGTPELVYIILAMVVVAVTAIVALEEAIPMPEGTAVSSAPAPPTGPVSRGSHARDSGPVRPRGVRATRLTLPTVALGALGLGAGLSPLFSAYYSTGVWTLVGLLLVIAAAMGTVARPPRITLPVSLLVLGVTGLGLWSLLSTTWAQAAEQAVVDGNLWLAYTALVLLTLVLIARRGHAVTLLACVGIGIGVVAASVLVRLLGTDPGTLFVGARLNFPLGYINGEGCVFAMGVWPALALAERRHPVVAATGVGASVVMASLALLSQSRGAAIATGITILLALFVIPGWRRRALAMAVIVGGFAAAASSVAHIYAVGKTGAVITTAAHHAGLAIAVAAFAAGLVWGVGVALANKVSLREGRLAVFAERVATVLAVVVIAAPLTAAAVSAPQLVRTARQQWYAFMHLGANEGAGGGVNSSQTRLFSGGGNRYDYWRVAWKVFKGHPVLGVGAGNYPAYYFRYRRTVESIENPHSLELQTAAELGVVGAAFLLLVFAGLGIGLVRQRSHARRSPAARGVMVAATGVSVVWLIDASGDWMHLLPGVAAIGLLALAALCRSSDVEISRDCGVAERSVPRLPALLGAATAIFILAVAGASLLRAALGQHYLDEAHAALHSHPATAIAVAQKALRLDGANLDAYYIMAAGQARFDRASAARSTLLAATRKDPQNFVTWALLGDLEVRAGDATAARAYYRRALSLDPREPTLKTLVTEPVRKLLRAAG